MSGAQTSGFPDQNKLLEANAQQLANYYAPERNRLFVQQATQEAGGREMEAMARVSAGLMSLDESKRADAYPGAVQYLQSLGYAKNAPPVYPGHDRIAQLASMGVPAEKQWEQQGVRTAADRFRESLIGSTPAAGSTPAGDGGPAVPRDPSKPTIGEQANNPGNLSAGVPGSTGYIVAADGQRVGVFPDVQTGVAAHAWQLARYGEQGIKTVQDAVNKWVGVPGKDNTAYVNAVAAKLGVKPGDPINLADPAVQKAFILAQQPNESGRQWLTPEQVDAGIVLASKPNFGKGGSGTPVAATTAPAVPVVPAAPPNRLLPPVGGGPPGGGMVGIDKPMSGGNADVLGALEPAQPAPTQFAGPGVPLPPPPATTGGFVGPGLEGGSAGNVLGGLVPVAPAAPAPAPAPAPVAPAPAPSVLPPLPTAPKPLIGNSGLTADQIQTLHGESLNARTPQQVAKLYADRQTYLQQNDTARKEYEAAVYARAEKAEADKARAVTQQLAMETNMRGWKLDQREEEKADRERVAANLPFPGKDPLSANKNILWKGSQPGGDTSTPEYRDAYQAVKYQAAPNGSVIQRDMPWAPPTGKGAETMKPPSFIAQPSDTARNEVRKADNDAIIISQAIDHYVDVFNQSGKNSWDAYWANPQSPEAQRLLGAFDAMKTTLRSPVYYNTGVLQPAEMKMLQDDLVSPSTLRGMFATPQAMAARLHEIKMAVVTRQDRELRSIGLPGSIVRNDKERDALPAGASYYDKDGNHRQKPEAE